MSISKFMVLRFMEKPCSDDISLPPIGREGRAFDAFVVRIGVHYGVDGYDVLDRH